MSDRHDQIRQRAEQGEYHCREHFGQFDTDEDVLFLLAENATLSDRLASLEVLQTQERTRIAEHLEALIDSTEREAMSYAETFAPSRRLEGRAEGLRLAILVVLRQVVLPTAKVQPPPSPETRE